MKIGEVAKKSGFSKDTLRYYEKIGVIQLSKQQRTAHNYRVYDANILQELQLIKKMKRIGFTLQEIKDWKQMKAFDRINCANLGALIEQKLEKIETELAKLKYQKQQLLALTKVCTGNCIAIFDETS